MGLTKAEIMDAVAMEDWQAYRLTMKRKPTKDKLQMCHEWLVDPLTTSNNHDKDVQVLNYLNSLARNGCIMALKSQDRGSYLLGLFNRKGLTILK